MTPDDFDYEPERLPLLVLGIHYDEWSLRTHPDVYKPHTFKAGKTYARIGHQTAGNGCNHHFIEGIILPPKNADVLRNMQTLSDEYLDSNTGVFGVSLNSLITYRDNLRRWINANADCNCCYKFFEEAIYPIDPDRAVIAELTDERLPERFDDLIEWPSGFASLAGCINRWNLFVLGENCD